MTIRTDKPLADMHRRTTAATLAIAKDPHLAPAMVAACLRTARTNLEILSRYNGWTPGATYSREKHAAHTGNGTGWDLERWDVIAVTVPKSGTMGIPSDAEYHVGYLDRAGVQHWIFTRRAALSGEKCVFC